jgi:hypothetical protein
MSASQPVTTHSSSMPSWHGFQTKTLPQVPKWIEPLERAGHFAKGVDYFIIGLLAFKLT